MKLCDDHGFAMSQPVFQAEHDTLQSALTALDRKTLEKRFACSSRLFASAWKELHLQCEGLGTPPSPAVLSYCGIAYASMAPSVFTQDEWTYVNTHLYILSAAYGLLRPLDALRPYRMEMAWKTPIDLTAFWKKKLAGFFDDEPVVNLASREYARALPDGIRRIDVRFFEEQQGRRKEKGVYVKIARGTMVRWMAENRVEFPEKLAAFDGLGYRFDPGASCETEYIFVRKVDDHD